MIQASVFGMRDVQPVAAGGWWIPLTQTTVGEEAPDPTRKTHERTR